MSEGISSIGNIAITALPPVQSAGRKPSFPVRPSLAVYASFKHIQVVPDSSLEGGIPLYKLSLLDSLMERLSRIPGKGPMEPREVTAETIDKVIGDLSGRLRGRSGPYLAGLRPGMGLVVDMVA